MFNYNSTLNSTGLKKGITLFLLFCVVLVFFNVIFVSITKGAHLPNPKEDHVIDDVSEIKCSSTDPGCSVQRWFVKYVVLVSTQVSTYLLFNSAQLASSTLNPREMFGKGFTDSEIVTVGWNISLSLVNMFFGLILLVIAFAVILGFESYGMKKLLPGLLMVILLINFSLAIAGVFIDFSQVLADTFIGAVGGPNFGNAAIARFNILPTGTLDPKAPPPDANKNSDTLWQIFWNSVINLLFALTASFILLVIAVTFVIRTFALWVLLIISPVAWGLYTLPDTQKYFSQWWSEFFKWIFFAPVCTFFLYLALSIQIGLTLPSGAPQQSLDSQVGTLAGFANFLIVGGLMLCSLIVGQKLGVTGAGAVMKWGEGAVMGAAKKFSGYNIGKRHKEALDKRGKGKEEEKQADANRHVKEAFDAKDDLMNKIPYAGRPFRSRKGQARYRESTAKKQVDDFYTKVNQKEPEDRQNMIDKEQERLQGYTGGIRSYIPGFRSQGVQSALTLAELQKGRDATTAPLVLQNNSGEDYEIPGKIIHTGPTELPGRQSNGKITEGSQLHKAQKQTEWAHDQHTRDKTGGKSELDKAREHYEHEVATAHAEKHKEDHPAGEGGAHANEKPAAGSNKDDHGHA